MKKNIRAIYFDLDDTLCGYWAASRKGLRQAFDEVGLACGTDAAIRAWREVFPEFSKEIKGEEWYGRYLESGEPTRTEHMRRVLQRLKCDDAKLADRLSALYAEHRNECLTLFPEARDVLEFLRGRYYLGLITNGPADVQRQEIDTLELADCFDSVLIEGELRVGKPHKAIFEEASARAGHLPPQMLFVGNAFEHDVQGAKRAGWWAIWVNKEREPNRSERTGPQPDLEVTDLWDVVAWLGHIVPEHKAPSTEPLAVRNWRA